MIKKHYLALTSIIIIILAVFSVFIFQKNNSPCEGCGGCDYDKFKDKVKVEKIVWTGDSIDTIYLKSIVDRKCIYQMGSYEYSVVIKKDFDEKEIKDTLKIYNISGERIKHGSCAPYSIQKMKLIRK